MKLTGCILAKNEESNMEGCLGGLSALTDQLILVDNGSTDKTKEIAMKYRAKIIESNDTYIDEARNIYLNEAKTEWVLILDADERIDVKFRDKIYEKISSAGNDVKGFYLPRYEYIGEGKWAEVEVARLIKVEDSIRYNNFKIHSSLTPSIVLNNGKLEKIDVPIHHFDILQKGRVHAKRDKYIKQIEWEIENNTNNPFIWTQSCNLGVEYMAKGDFDEAIELFNHAMDISERAFHFSNIYIAQCYLLKNENKKAEDLAVKLIDTKSRFSERANLVLAEIAIREKKYIRAIELCETSLKKNTNSAHNYLNLASLIYKDEPQRAINLIDQAVSMNSLLMDPSIYQIGERPNLFYYQNSFLSTYTNIFDVYIYCYEILGDKKKVDEYTKLKLSFDWSMI